MLNYLILPRREFGRAAQTNWNAGLWATTVRSVGKRTSFFPFQRRAELTWAVSLKTTREGSRKRILEPETSGLLTLRSANGESRFQTSCPSFNGAERLSERSCPPHPKSIPHN